MIAVRLASGAVDLAVAAARDILDPAQQQLPDDLTAALESACAAWDRGEPASANEYLATALRLARDLRFF